MLFLLLSAVNLPTILIALLILAAFVAVIVRGVRKRRQGGGCGCGCSGCGGACACKPNKPEN